MSESKEHRTETRIEAAMRNHGHDTTYSKTDAVPQEEKRRLQRRLEQLKTTMGESQPTASIEKQTPNPTPIPVVTAHEPGHSMRKLLLVSGVSFLIGAGLMWFALKTPQPAPVPPLDTHPTIASSKPVDSTAQASSASTPAQPPALKPAPTHEQEARALLEGWRQAWENRDVNSYLSFYDPAFAPKGQSHNKWAALRRAKLANQSAISIQIREIRIDPIGEQQMKVSFLQDYASGTYSEVARAKTLQLRYSAKGWLIVGEQKASKRK
jgi:hypothetical protein